MESDSRARLVYSHRAHATLVTEHLDEGFFLVGRPEGDRAVMVAQVDDGIVRVLAHHIKSAGLGADGCHFFSQRHIKVLQEACGTLRTRTGGFVKSIFQILFIFSCQGFSHCESLREMCSLNSRTCLGIKALVSFSESKKSSESIAYLYAQSKLMVDSAHSKWGILGEKHASSIGTSLMYLPLWQAKSGKGGTAYGGRR